MTDVRRILMDFTLIQLKESVKSVELLTAMYNDVASIDVDKDMEVNQEREFNVFDHQNKICPLFLGN